MGSLSVSRRDRGGCGCVIVDGSFSTSLWAYVWEKCPQGHVILKSHAITDSLARGVAISRDVCPVIVRNVHKILKKGLYVHGIHPFLDQSLALVDSSQELGCAQQPAVTYLQPHAILCNLLGALLFVRIRRLNAELGRQLSPCPDLAVVELADQVIYGKGAEGLAAAARRVAEGLAQAGRVRVERDGGIAEEDEVNVSVLDRLLRDAAVRKAPAPARGEAWGRRRSGSGPRCAGLRWRLSRRRPRCVVGR